jgi:hypothetical protein
MVGSDEPSQIEGDPINKSGSNIDENSIEMIGFTAYCIRISRLEPCSLSIIEFVSALID